MPEFIHLHVHTEYSLLDGAIRLKDLCQRAKDLGMPAVAITDHGNMHGAVTFYQMALSMGLKPIIGCETYVAPGAYDVKTPDNSGAYHLLLLAKNNLGYKNLIKLVSEAYTNGFYYKPRVDKDLLRKYSDGLIATSACLGGEVCRKLKNEGLDAGIATAQEYADIFPDNFYLEVQANGLEDQERANRMLVDVAAATGLPLVATNDCHYLQSDDAEAHEVLLCIQTQTTMHDEKRMKMGTDQLYFKTPEEMETAFAHIPEAIANTQRIAERCNVQIELGHYSFPNYELTEGSSIDEEFESLTRQGLAERLANLPYEIDEQVYQERLEYELGIISEMGFPAYFLIVQDFINWAKDNRIPVGPGRGSAAGSIVAWALKITNLDPIPYALLFERFLNVERISMPDIDVDFCERRRLEVVKYCSEKYGKDHVAQITTFGTMKAKAVVRDVGRALGMTFGETDKIAKLIPDEMKMTISKALEMEPELRIQYESDPQIKHLLEISKRLEGLCRHASTHAAGVVISDKPMTEYLPLYKGKKEEIVTQYDMKRVEKVGLIKFDFLGLRTMTVVEDCLDIIREQGREAPDLDTLALDDPDTYELIYQRGDTDGVFQVESSGMRKYLRMLKPSTFEDIIAMLALYRPGPLNSGMVDEFIKRKHGEIPVTYPHASLEETLKPTYGVMVYQEQVMATAMIVANYSLGEGDLLRRAMGKKIASEMASQRKRFLEGSKENGIPSKTANEIFDLMEKFAEYGFNKSHSAAYALISYYTAYLKAHHKVEFMAALMSSELGNADKVYAYINACRDMEIKVVPPDVNGSRNRFSVRDNTILFGLGGVKNVGAEAVHEIVREREENGPYKDLVDFCLRVNLRRVTKRVIEYLVKAGAMDSMGCTRNGLIEALPKAVSLGQKKAKEKASGMLNMLDMLGGGPPGTPTEENQGLCLSMDELDAEEWGDREKQRYEKEALGFFLTSHPLLAYRPDLMRMRLSTLEQCKDMPDGVQVKTAIIVPARKEYITKKGEKMAFCTVEDLTGQGEVTMLPNVYAEAKELLDLDEPLYVEGKVDKREGPGEEGMQKAKLLAEKVKALAPMVEACVEPYAMTITEAHCADDKLRELSDIMRSHPGRAPVCVELKLPDTLCRLNLGNGWKVNPDKAFRVAVEAWLGD